MFVLRLPAHARLAVFALALSGVFVPTARAASMDFIYQPPEAAGDERHLY